VSLADLRHAREDMVDHRLVGGKERRALGRDRILLAGALGAFRPDVAELFEQGQRRVDDAGARAVGAAKALLDRLDQFIAVTRSAGVRGRRPGGRSAWAEHPARAPAPSAGVLVMVAVAAAEQTAAGVAAVVMVVSMSKHSQWDDPWLSGRKLFERVVRPHDV